MEEIITTMRCRKRNFNKYIDIVSTLNDQMFQNVADPLYNLQYFYVTYQMNVDNMIEFNTLFNIVADKFFIFDIP